MDSQSTLTAGDCPLIMWKHIHMDRNGCHPYLTLFIGEAISLIGTLENVGGGFQANNPDKYSVECNLDTVE